MKCLIALSALLVVALADDPHGLTAAHEKCHMVASDGSPKPATSSEGGPHEGHHDHKAEHHVENFKCLAKTLGLVNDEGKIVADGVKLHVGHVITDANKVEEIVKICGQDKDSADATAGHVVKCLYEKHVFSHDGKHHGSSENNERDSSHQHHHDHVPKLAVAPAKV
ncbi:uncharacterized protein [Euwallacea fornicatus]|uniref:uncharacterized protein n=1 Tax=Euwallacea fornicatus TaxID=995702 RepID=UPI00338FB281